LSETRGVTTYFDGGSNEQRLYAFARGVDDHLYVNYYQGGGWNWQDQTGLFGPLGPGGTGGIPGLALRSSDIRLIVTVAPRQQVKEIQTSSTTLIQFPPSGLHSAKDSLFADLEGVSQLVEPLGGLPVLAPLACA
jgi:hypothetical protein